MKKEAKMNMNDFIYELQKLPAKDVISEIMTSGLPDKDVIAVMKAITFNDTFIYESKVEGDELMRKHDTGEFLWLFDWVQGGFNDVWAFTKEEAIKKVEYERVEHGSNLEPVPSSFRKATTKTWEAQNRAGWMMSC